MNGINNRLEDAAYTLCKGVGSSSVVLLDPEARNEGGLVALAAVTSDALKLLSYTPFALFVGNFRFAVSVILIKEGFFPNEKELKKRQEDPFYAKTMDNIKYVAVGHFVRSLAEVSSFIIPVANRALPALFWLDVAETGYNAYTILRNQYLERNAHTN